MISLRRISALCLASSLVLAGCESSSTPAELEFEGSREGTVTFNYAGARSGTFSASGKYGLDGVGNVERVPFAIGLRYFDQTERETLVNLSSFSPRSTRVTDIMDLYLESEVVAGETVSLDLASCLDAGQTLKERCGLGFFAFGVDPDDLSQGDVWETVGGTLRVDVVTRFNMRGTFSATLRNTLNGEQITITGGAFNVPVVDEDDAARFSAAPRPARLAWPGRGQ